MCAMGSFRVGGGRGGGGEGVKEVVMGGGGEGRGWVSEGRDLRKNEMVEGVVRGDEGG